MILRLKQVSFQNLTFFKLLFPGAHKASANVDCYPTFRFFLLKTYLKSDTGENENVFFNFFKSKTETKLNFWLFDECSYTKKGWMRTLKKIMRFGVPVIFLKFARSTKSLHLIVHCSHCSVFDINKPGYCCTWKLLENITVCNITQK